MSTVDRLEDFLSELSTGRAAGTAESPPALRDFDVTRLVDQCPRWQRNFVHGSRNPIGLECTYKLEWEEDGLVTATGLPPHRVATEWECAEDLHGGFAGAVHGGLLFAVVDDTMARAATLLDGQPRMSARVEIRYRHVVRLGALIRVEARLVDVRRHLALTAAVVRVDDVVVAEATGMYSPLTEEAADLARSVAGEVAG